MSRLGLRLLLVLAFAGCVGGNPNLGQDPGGGGDASADPGPGGCGDGACPCDRDEDCGGLTPRCDRNSGRCVACLPAAGPPAPSDCPAGQRCIASNGSFVCASSCRDDADCPRTDAGVPLACCGSACVDVQEAVEHCGACGRPCPVPAHASASCGQGICGLGSCNARFADCDRSAANGCEVDTGTDPGHCGACGAACTAGSHQAAACSDGACRLTCADGWADCDGNAANGCEADTATGLDHCGGCGKVCPVPANGTPACVGGTCGLGACNAGFGDCDRMAANGCETNTENDVAHCGGCGAKCAPAHAAPACARGLCQIGKCDAGFADCDAIAGSGCETDIAGDARNCGVCSRVCAGPRSAQACMAGRCIVSACDPGQADCDRIADTGCEVDTATSLAHCGGCDRPCAMVQNGKVACGNAQCRIGSCDFGFDDCNKNLGDGCETSLLALTSCGACGIVCPVPANATAACAGGLCGIGRCEGLFGDCDKLAANGCEKGLAADPLNCGACGNACPAVAGATPTCANAACGFTCDGGRANCDANAGNGCEVDTRTSTNHCGRCNAPCAIGSRCVNSVCVAPQLVGSFRPSDGPPWGNNPPCYSCIEACALLFGGAANDYQCSTQQGMINRRAYVDGWGDATYCVQAQDDTFKRSVRYNCGSFGCAYSAYVRDHVCNGVNYCYR